MEVEVALTHLWKLHMDGMGLNGTLWMCVNDKQKTGETPLPLLICRQVIITAYLEQRAQTLQYCNMHVVKYYKHVFAAFKLFLQCVFF